jgi:hypothetical protein
MLIVCIVATAESQKRRAPAYSEVATKVTTSEAISAVRKILACLPEERFPPAERTPRRRTTQSLPNAPNYCRTKEDTCPIFTSH